MHKTSVHTRRAIADENCDSGPKGVLSSSKLARSPDTKSKLTCPTKGEFISAAETNGFNDGPIRAFRYIRFGVARQWALRCLYRSHYPDHHDFVAGHQTHVAMYPQSQAV